jgi:dihydroorotase
MVGLETAASVAQLVLIESGKSNWQRLAEVLSHNPAAIGGDEGQGQAIELGAAANIALINPKAKRKIASKTASKSLNNPYAGLELPGAVVHTVFNGRLTVQDGQLIAEAKN